MPVIPAVILQKNDPACSHRPPAEGNETQSIEVPKMVSIWKSDGSAEATAQTFSIVERKLYLNDNDDIEQSWSQDTAGYIRKADKHRDAVKKQPTCSDRSRRDLS